MKILYFKLLSFAVCVLFLCCSDKIDFTESIDVMNSPEYLLTKSGPWDINQFERGVIYSNTALKNDIDSLCALHLSHIEHAARLTGMTQEGIDLMPKFNIWLFKDIDDKYRKTQLKSIHCISDYNAVYYPAEESKSAHEYGHLLAYYNWGHMLNRKYSLFLDEAFAYYVDEGRAFKFEYYEKAKEILDNDGYAVSKILAGETPFDLFANKGRKKAFVCAAFIKYLVNSYGIEKFAGLWKAVRKNDSGAFQQIYNKDMPELEQEFYRFLKIDL